PRLRVRHDLLGEETLEALRGLLGEDDPVEVLGRDARLREAEAHGASRERGVVLHAREALFGGRRDRRPVLHDRRGGVVVEGGQSEDSHPYCERRRASGVREWSGFVQPDFGVLPRTIRPNGSTTVKYMTTRPILLKPAAERAPRRFHAPKKREPFA